MLYFRQFNSFKLINFLIILELKGHGFYFIYSFFSCGSIYKYIRGGEPKYIYLRANLNFCGSIPVFFFFSFSVGPSLLILMFWYMLIVNIRKPLN